MGRITFMDGISAPRYAVTRIGLAAAACSFAEGTQT